MRRFGRCQLGHRRLDGRLLLPIFRKRRLEGQQSRCVELGRHVGEHPLDRLVVGDRLTELLAPLRVSDRLGNRRLADAERLRGNRHASALQRPHREPEALVDVSQHLIVGDLQVEIEIHAAEAADAERVGAGGARNAGRVHRHQKSRDALSAQTRTRAGKHDGDRRFLRVRHPHLAAANAIAVALAYGGRLLIRGIGPGVGLRQRERADRLAGGQPPQPALALLITSGMSDDLGDERIGHRQRHRDGRAAFGDRLDRQRVAQIIAAGTAPRDRNGDAEQPVLRRGVHDVGRVFAALVDRGGARRDDVARECFDGRLEGALFRGQIEMHVAVSRLPVRAARRSVAAAAWSRAGPQAGPASRRRRS